MWDVDTPAITTRLRGMVYVELTLHAACERDLHSGLFGGSALNPINALTRILGDLHDADGRIQLPGFYDGVTETPPAQAWRNGRRSASTRRRSWAASASRCRWASAAARRWSGCGRGRPPTSTAFGAATPAPAARR